MTGKARVVNIDFDQMSAGRRRELFDEWVEAVGSSSAVSEAARQLAWLISADLENDPGNVRLDNAFGMTAQDVKISERNKLLRHVRHAVPEWRDLPVSKAAVQMKMAFERYAGSRWNIDKKGAAAPASEPNATWWRIKRLGVLVPEARQIANILSSA